MPESVRRMAETMVREKRLQRLLAARGAFADAGARTHSRDPSLRQSSA